MLKGGMVHTHMCDLHGLEEAVPVAQTSGDGVSQARPVGNKVRVGVLSNPRSGGNQHALRPVLKVLAENPHVPHCEVQTPDDVALALSDFASKEVEVVTINGGDGTIQAVLSAMLKNKPFPKLPTLAVLSAGTTSMIAGDVGMRGVPARALRRLLVWASAGTPNAVILERHVLRVQSSPEQEPHYGMFFGAGAIDQGIRFCRQKIESRGLRGELGPGLTLLWFLLTLLRGSNNYVSSVPATVHLDGRLSEQRECLLLIVSTLERLFLGLHPYWGTEGGPLKFTAVSAGPRYLLRVLPSLLRGRPHPYGLPEHGYHSSNVHEVRLFLDGGYTLDGELFAAKSESGPLVLQAAGPVSFLRC